MPFPYSLPIHLPNSAASLPVYDHEATALARLAQYLRDKPNTTAVLGAFTAQHQDLETAVQQLLVDRTLDNAFGEQLDILGDLVGQPREGADDTTYRQRVRARVALNRSSGTSPELIALFLLLVPTATLKLRDEWPAALTLEVNGVAVTSATAAILVYFLRLAKVGGVRAILEWGEAPPAELFQMDAGLGFDQGKFRGAAL